MYFSKQNLKLFLVVMVFLLFPIFVSARGLVPCGGEGESPCNIQDIFILIARTTNFLLSLAGAYAVYKIIQSGFWMTITMGNEESITTNKKRITNAIVGLCFTFMAYIFVSFIVNYALVRGYKECKIDLRNPLTYLTIKDPESGTDPNNAACRAAHQKAKKTP